MAVFIGEQEAYVWPDGSTQSLAPPSRPIHLSTDGSVNLVGGRPISYAHIYRTQPWVAAAVHLLQRQVARLPLHTFLPEGDDEANRKRTRDHPLAKILASPAERRSPLKLKAQVMLGLLVHGNHLERIVRDRPGRPPVGLEWIDWRLVQPLLSDDKTRVIAWRVNSPGATGEPEILGPEDVIHFTWPAPDGPIGVSPLEQLEVTVRSEDAAQRYADSSLRNGGMNGVGLVVDKAMAKDPEIRKMLRDEVKNRHLGPDRAHEPYILGAIESVQSLPVQTAVEAELINQRKVNREEVAAVYGTPPVLIQDLSHATYSNVAAMHSMLYLTVLGPWLSLVAEELDSQLIRPTVEWSTDGVWAEWILDEVLKGDVKARMEAYLAGRNAGALTLNDIRRKENLPAYDDPKADEPLIQTNNVEPLSQIGSGDDGQGDGETDPDEGDEPTTSPAGREPAVAV